jgi:hypothetical protein
MLTKSRQTTDMDMRKILMMQVNRQTDIGAFEQKADPARMQTCTEVDSRPRGRLTDMKARQAKGRQTYCRNRQSDKEVGRIFITALTSPM